MSDTKEKLSATTVWLHWVVGITVILLLAVGVYMNETETAVLYPIHKSIGVLIFMVVMARVAWRVKTGWPERIGTHRNIERVLAKISHWTLIIGTLVMPVSGMMMSGAGGHGFGIFGLGLVPANPDPSDPEKVIPYNKALAEVGHELHEIVGYLLIAAVLLHITAALKHHLIDRDGTLRRMLGAKI